MGNTNVSQQNFFEDKTFVNNQNKDFDNWTNNHRVTANLELNLDSFNYIKISPQFTYGGNKNQNLAGFEYFEDNNVMTSEGFNRETQILLDLKHPHIVKFVDWFESRVCSLHFFSWPTQWRHWS